MGKKNKGPMTTFFGAPLLGITDPLTAGAVSLKQAHDEKKLTKGLEEANAASEEAAKATAAKQAEVDALKAAEEQQELVRKKYAAMGRISSGTAFSDAAATASTRTFS